jgi:hypothetical protein
LDDLTSGLDADLAYNIVQYLKEVSIRNDIMIIMAIHQPSSHLFSLFDNLLFLNQGLQIYSGPADDVLSYLSIHGIVKPTDWSLSDFLFEVFAQKSSFKDIESIRDKASKFLLNLSFSFNENLSNYSQSSKLRRMGGFRFDHFFVLLKRIILFDSEKSTIAKTLGLAFIINLILFIKLRKIHLDASDMIAVTVLWVLSSADPKVVIINQLLLLMLLYIKAFYSFFNVSSIFDEKFFKQVHKECTKSYYSVTTLFFSYLAYECLLNIVVAFFIVAGFLLIAGENVINSGIYLAFLLQSLLLVLPCMLFNILYWLFCDRKVCKLMIKIFKVLTMNTHIGYFYLKSIFDDDDDLSQIFLGFFKVLVFILYPNFPVEYYFIAKYTLIPYCLKEKLINLIHECFFNLDPSVKNVVLCTSSSIFITLICSLILFHLSFPVYIRLKLNKT